LYNHINDIGAIALDVGFSFPAAFASIMKESCLQLNETLSGSRYLKGINTAGGILCGFSAANKQVLMERLVTLKKDLSELKGMMLSSVSFMDRADGAGVLRKKTAQDLGVLGVAGRASGIVNDLRKDLPGIYGQVKFKSIHYISGDVSARLNVRFGECEESFSIMDQFLQAIQPLEALPPPAAAAAEGCALGYVESWRGPVLYWVKLEANGRIERCKIVDPSFRNWEGLAFAMPGNIIPDFPVCNKSFNLSYPGSDL
jgi:Ni,Fe-hydrogenase III large subunit